jgi:hypothetical protein
MAEMKSTELAEPDGETIIAKKVSFNTARRQPSTAKFYDPRNHLWATRSSAPATRKPSLDRFL